MHLQGERAPHNLERESDCLLPVHTLAASSEAQGAGSPGTPRKPADETKPSPAVSGLWELLFIEVVCLYLPQ